MENTSEEYGHLKTFIQLLNFEYQKVKETVKASGDGLNEVQT